MSTIESPRELHQPPKLPSDGGKKKKGGGGGGGQAINLKSVGVLGQLCHRGLISVPL